MQEIGSRGKKREKLLEKTDGGLFNPPHELYPDFGEGGIFVASSSFSHSAAAAVSRMFELVKLDILREVHEGGEWDIAEPEAMETDGRTGPFYCLGHSGERDAADPMGVETDKLLERKSIHSESKFDVAFGVLGNAVWPISCPSSSTFPLTTSYLPGRPKLWASPLNFLICSLILMFLTALERAQNTASLDMCNVSVR